MGAGPQSPCQACSPKSISVSSRLRYQHIIKRPTGVAHGCPFVVIGRSTPECEPRQPRSASDQLASPQWLHGCVLARLRLITPIEPLRETPAIAEPFGRTCTEIRARFNQQHRARRGLRQSSRHHTPRGPATDHNNVKFGPAHEVMLWHSAGAGRQSRGPVAYPCIEHSTGSRQAAPS